jgi:hypothetical protein
LKTDKGPIQFAGDGTSDGWSGGDVKFGQGPRWLILVLGMKLMFVVLVEAHGEGADCQYDGSVQNQSHSGLILDCPAGDKLGLVFQLLVLEVLMIYDLMFFCQLDQLESKHI